MSVLASALLIPALLSHALHLPLEPAPVDSTHQTSSVTGSRHQARTMYASVLSAVENAARSYIERSAALDTEYMGGVLEYQSRFTYTASAGVRGADEVTVRIQIPRGHRLVALWHTHGASGDDRRYFSDVDTRLANAMDLPFYLADPNGFIRVFSPGDRTLRPRTSQRLGLGYRRGYAAGHRTKSPRVYSGSSRKEGVRGDDQTKHHGVAGIAGIGPVGKR